MESIGIDELKRGTNEAVCYADDCLFVSESLQCLCTSEPVRLDFSLMVFCMEGCVEWEQNGSFCALHEHDFVITLPGTLLTNLVVSDDCRMKVVCVSDRFLRRMLRASTNVWHVIRFVKSNPLKHLSDSDFEYLLRYVDLISIELKNGASIYREEIVQHLFAALIFGMLSDINRCMASENETDRDKTTTPVYMFRRFMEEVSADNGCHRSVTYYAGRLVLSSFLSVAYCKKSQRKTCFSHYRRACDRPYCLRTEVFGQVGQRDSDGIRFPEYFLFFEVCTQTSESFSNCFSQYGVNG